ncbi:MAG: aminoacyl-tRNA hydrolase [Clostridiales bacterium]|nr:aminoacyl-tRNA hydrolase [Clostridiales bacterium]
MYLIVGLGNPGKEYEYTKHNAGFLIIDDIAKKLNININKSKFKGLWCQSELNGEKIIFLKPQTYMNLSGESIIEVVNFFKIPKENVIVIYDDLDIDMCKIRIRERGTAGSHNGMKSIVQHLGTTNFPRIRIGTKKDNENIDTIDYVLSNFSKEQLDNIHKLSDDVLKILSDTVKGNIQKAMNKYN